MTVSFVSFTAYRWTENMHVEKVLGFHALVYFANFVTEKCNFYILEALHINNDKNFFWIPQSYDLFNNDFALFAAFFCWNWSLCQSLNMSQYL